MKYRKKVRNAVQHFSAIKNLIGEELDVERKVNRRPRFSIL